MGEEQFYLHDHDRNDSMVDREQLNEAIGLLSKLLNSSTVTAVSDTVQQLQQPSTVAINAATEEEMRRLFRNGSKRGTSTLLGANASVSMNQVMRP